MSNKLAKCALRYIELADRSRHVFSSLGIDDLERALIITLSRNPGPWAVTSLAEYIKFNRTTVYRRLLAREKRGLLFRIEGKWLLTDVGRDNLIRLINEVTAVIFGEQDRLSEELIQLCFDISPDANPDEARLITFKHSKIRM